MEEEGVVLVGRQANRVALEAEEVVVETNGNKEVLQEVEVEAGFKMIHFAFLYT